MSNQLVMEKRTEQGRKAKALRAAGLIPSVIYGTAEPILASSTYNATEKVLLEAGYHSPIELVIEGKPQLAIAKKVSIDPVSRRIVNVEFQAVSADEIVEATAPIKVMNYEQSEASKLHYVLLQVLEEVDVKAKPSNLPEELVIDGSKLAGLDSKLTLADLQMPNGVELVDKELSSATVIANVYDPAAEAAAREAGNAPVETTEEPEKAE